MTATNKLLVGGFGVLLTMASWCDAITIGPGPAIGMDKRGTVWYQEFQDWQATDLRALDNNADVTLWDSDNTSRDIIAFYSKDDGANYAFRVDFFDMRMGVENGGLDLYLLIDCVGGGRTSFPDSVRCNVDPAHPWDLAVKVYDGVFRFVEDSSGSTLTTNFPTYWNSELDSVEFSIPRSFLTAKGWNGNSTLYFQVASGKDFSNQVADAVGNFTPATPSAFGSLTGAVPSDSITGRAKYAVIAHANQSVAPRSGTQGHIYKKRPDLNLYPGFIRLLDSAEMFNTPINLHISGTLMMSFLWAEQNPADTDYPDRDGPTFMARCRDFVTTGPGSLIGGVLAEHIMPYFEGQVNAKSIEQNSQLIEHYFGLTEQDMKVMHVPERVIRTQTNHPQVSASGPLDGKTFEEIENSGFTATYLDEVTHLHWWFYPQENNPGGSPYGGSWDDSNCGRWAGGGGNDEAAYHHKVHKINGVYTFMINDREDQSKFGNDDGGMMKDTRYTLLQKALHPDSAQITIVFDDWEALAGNSFASPDPNNNADQFHKTLRWAANHQWIELKNLKDVLDWAVADTNWVVDHGFVYDKTSQTYEWLKRASEHTYDNWYYGTALEESFFNRTARVHNAWAPAGMKKYGDMNTPGTLIRDSWDVIQQITNAPYLKMISEWSYSAMIYETAWHDEDANPDQYQSRNYQTTFNRNDSCTFSYEDTTYDPVSGWATRLHGHVRDMGVMKAASDWIRNIKNGTQGPQTTVYAADIDDDQLHEYVLCNDKVFLCIERWGARVIKAFVYDPFMNGGDARMVVGVPISNPPEESENEGANNNRNSVFKDHWSTGQASNGYIDMDYADPVVPVAGIDSWTFQSQDGRIRKRIQLPRGLDVAYAHYSVSSSIGTLYVRNGLGPNQLDIMFNGAVNLQRLSDASFKGLRNIQGGETYMVRGGTNTALNAGTIADSGWDNRELPMIEIFEVNNTGNATNFSMAVAFSEMSARDADGDGLNNTNEWLVGTDSFSPDSDGDQIPDGWEVAQSLNPLNGNDAWLDGDGDGMNNWQEYIAGTLPGISASYFALADSMIVNGRNEIRHDAQSGRVYQVYYADQNFGSSWNWQSFVNTNIPYGSYLHLAAPGSHTFTDDFTAATSGSIPTNGMRLYSIRVGLPE